MGLGVLRTRGLRHLLGVFLVHCCAGTSGAQEIVLSTFGESIVVDLVNVEVWVTDGEGRPIRGLTKADFEILEDGRSVEITHFREVDVDSRTEPAPAGRVSPELKPVGFVGTSVPDIDLGHLVIYLDDLHLRLGGRKRMIRDLRRFLEQTAVPAEQMLVVRQDQKLTAQTLFGSTIKGIDAALDGLTQAPPESALTEQQRWLTLDRLQRIWERLRESARPGERPCDEFVRAARPEIETFARESQMHVLQTLDHLSSMITFLAGVPGPKTLLYLSDSLQMGPGEDLLRFVTDICPTSRRQTTPIALGAALNDSFRRLTGHASANRVTIYSLQPEGLRAGFVGSAEQRAVDMQGMRSLQATVRHTDREGLSYLAYETGGRAIFNRNSLLQDLASIGTEMGAYYSIAYQPPRDNAKIEHRIDVRVRGDYRVRHRRGYRFKARDEQMIERLQGALHLGLVTNPLAVKLAAGEAVPEGRKNRVRLHVLVPSDRLVFLPVDKGKLAEVTVVVQAQGENKRLEATERQRFQVSQPPPGGPDSIDLILPIELKEGVYDIAVGVRDEASNQTSYVSTFLRVKQASE